MESFQRGTVRLVIDPAPSGVGAVHELPYGATTRLVVYPAPGKAKPQSGTNQTPGAAGIPFYALLCYSSIAGKRDEEAQNSA